ncbi:hypothetical protein [Phycicoccus duodecadis]|uniref:DUF4352 domain-containing protein n=1 Tax=Phycicoccus duodecadis TaxID=173053 RepID=A0A2N3YIT9_9MICO|nr:hypothetical protein [Phycicoccus duodecadis]PKW26767.1 hypothetical protein ATL31_1589 [Phycicoccus duodecadis]
MSVTTRRVVLGAAAWSTPVIVVGTAAPALAASGTSVTATYAVDRQSGLVVQSGVITNQGAVAVVVTIRIQADLTTGTITGGQLNNDTAWTTTYFNWTDGTGNDMTSASYVGNTNVPLAPGDSIATPDVGYSLDSDAATGTTRLTLSVPAPSTAVDPAPLPVPPFAALTRSSTTPKQGFPPVG